MRDAGDTLRHTNAIHTAPPTETSPDTLPDTTVTLSESLGTQARDGLYWTLRAYLPRGCFGARRLGCANARKLVRPAVRVSQCCYVGASGAVGPWLCTRLPPPWPPRIGLGDPSAKGRRSGPPEPHAVTRFTHSRPCFSQISPRIITTPHVHMK